VCNIVVELVSCCSRWWWGGAVVTACVCWRPGLVFINFHMRFALPRVSVSMRCCVVLGSKFVWFSDRFLVFAVALSQSTSGFLPASRYLLWAWMRMPAKARHWYHNGWDRGSNHRTHTHTHTEHKTQQQQQQQQQRQQPQ
jgi:hypothetical protein